MKTWIKICGITNLEDAQAALRAGADALGFIFTASPRQVDVEAVREIVRKLPTRTETFGVLVNESPERISQIVAQSVVSGVQLHGDESAEDVARLRAQLGDRKILKTIPAAALPRAADFTDIVDALLIDSGNAASRGGTGQVFDWKPAKNELKRLPKLRVVISGGLTPENVRDAVCFFRPYGVDVSSGVEREPGRKDHEKLRRFISTVRDVDSGRTGCCPPIA